jgi:hypothetical protein
MIEFFIARKIVVDALDIQSQSAVGRKALQESLSFWMEPGSGVSY